MPGPRRKKANLKPKGPFTPTARLDPTQVRDLRGRTSGATSSITYRKRPARAAKRV